MGTIAYVEILDASDDSIVKAYNEIVELIADKYVSAICINGSMSSDEWFKESTIVESWVKNKGRCNHRIFGGSDIIDTLRKTIRGGMSATKLSMQGYEIVDTETFIVTNKGK